MTDDRRNRLQGELQAIVDKGLPRALNYVEDADGRIECDTAGVADLSTVDGHGAPPPTKRPDEQCLADDWAGLAKSEGLDNHFHEI